MRIKNKLWLLRNGYTGSLQGTMQHLADLVLVSTPDLLKFANNLVTYHPVDTELFNESTGILNKDYNMMQLLLKLKR